MIHKKYARDIFQALISQASIGAAHGKSLSFVFRRREQLVCKNHSPKSLTTKATKVHEEKRPQIDSFVVLREPWWSEVSAGSPARNA
jgi:hypothetical protein